MQLKDFNAGKQIQMKKVIQILSTRRLYHLGGWINRSAVERAFRLLTLMSTLPAAPQRSLSFHFLKQCTNTEGLQVMPVLSRDLFPPVEASANSPPECGQSLTYFVQSSCCTIFCQTTDFAFFLMYFVYKMQFRTV